MIDCCDETTAVNTTPAFTASPPPARPIVATNPDKSTTLTLTLTPIQRQVAVGVLSAVGAFMLCWMATRALSAAPRSPRVQPAQSAPAEPPAPAPPLAAAPELTAKIAALESELAALKRNSDSDGRSINYLLSQAEFKNQWVSLDPASPGFHRVNSSAGFFLVSFQSAQPYLDGYKVVLRIGNPTVAVYEGVKISAAWGARGRADDRIPPKLRNMDVNLPGRLEPGSWNDVEMVLPATQSNEMGEVRVALETNRVSLFVPRR